MAITTFAACSKETVIVDVAPPEGELRVSDARLEQYIFRSFVDLLGSAPSESEVVDWSQRLRSGDYSAEVRLELIETLQTDPGYRSAYANNLYQSAKERFIENLDDAELKRRFAEIGAPEQNMRIRQLLEWSEGVLTDTTNYLDLQRLCVFNGAYDQVNMGSFNFVRATFDNLLWRFPTDEEYEAGFDMVNDQEQATLFGKEADSKAGYIEIITASEEALQGTAIWQYQQLLARRPTAAETLAAVPALRSTRNVIDLQKVIMQSDEYAGF